MLFNGLDFAFVLPAFLGGRGDAARGEPTRLPCLPLAGRLASLLLPLLLLLTGLLLLPTLLLLPLTLPLLVSGMTSTSGVPLNLDLYFLLY